MRQILKALSAILPKYAKRKPYNSYNNKWIGLTITGNSSVNGNEAKGVYGMGGGIYNANSPITLNFAGVWENTAEGTTGNTNGTPAGSNIYTVVDKDVRLLGGTFVGDKSIVGYRSTETVGQIWIDPVQVKFDPGATGYAIHSENPRTQIVLLQQLPNDKNLAVSINEDNFKPGSMLILPANTAAITVAKLQDDANRVGGRKINDTVQQSYTPCKDVSKNAGGSANISVSANPSRASFSAVPDTADVTLINMGFVGEGIYLDGKYGDDGNDGLSPTTAVKTFAKAKERLKENVKDTSRSNGFRPVIWVSGTVTIAQDTEITLKQGDVDPAGLKRYITAETNAVRTPDKVSVQRYAALNASPMFLVTGGTLVLNTIKLNGNAESVTAPANNVTAPIILLNGSDASLDIENGARLYNNLTSSLVYISNAKSVIVNQSYTEEQTDKENDELYGAQLDASQNKNGTRCPNLIYVNTRNQTPDITVSGTAWLNMASPSGSIDANGIYMYNSNYQDNQYYSSGANVTLTGQAKISGETNSYSGGTAVGFDYINQNITLKMEQDALIRNVGQGFRGYYAKANITILMQGNAKILDARTAIAGGYNRQNGSLSVSMTEEARIGGTNNKGYSSGTGILIGDGSYNDKITIRMDGNSKIYCNDDGIELGSSTVGHFYY